ncbi:MAG: DegT/DnrJ/EryC1/StrS family aminotransferase, partial [Bacteroidia bacterium]|nr:DegT/DnrJ/EryC1/StrS family aminotransferase [Bacteroidia bacterium]
LAEKARRLRQHGLLRNPSIPWDYNVQELGWNYMLSDFQAAVALAQTERWEELRQRRERLAHLYLHHLQGHPTLRPYPFPASDKLSWHLFPVFWEEGSASRRALLYQTLQAQGFHLNLHYKPLHLHPAYQPYLQPHHRFPVADWAYERILTLPLWPDMPPACAHRLLTSLLQALSPAPLSP